MEQTEECCVPILDKELLHGNIRHEQEKNNELFKTSLDKGTQRKTTENELPSLTQCTA